jgi:hypothetical protein
MDTDEFRSFISVKERLDGIRPSNTDGGFPVKPQTPIANLLTKVTKLLSSPAVSFVVGRFHNDDHLACLMPLQVGGEDAGTFENPNMDKIMEKSAISPFGKGDKTVVDLDYRNGREIVASDVVVGGKRDAEQFLSFIEDRVSEFLFRDKPVKAELYKLTMYGKEGHFDWHRDTTHGDDHHATVLVALNTEWKGGELKLRYEGNTVDVDMHPLWKKDAYEEKHFGTVEFIPYFKVVAFYTDIEHKVDPVTEGSRIVLQYDIKVQNDQDDNNNKSDKGDDLNTGNVGEDFLRVAGDNAWVPLFPSSAKDDDHDAQLKALVKSIKKEHKSVDEIVFPLRHLYRVTAIKPEYLKGADEYLYESLKEKFDVQLKPIAITQQSGYEGEYELENIVCHIFPSTEKMGGEQKRRKIEKTMELHLPEWYELMKISSIDYNEYTGNEAQFGEHKYFGAGMFIAAKE